MNVKRFPGRVQDLWRITLVTTVFGAVGFFMLHGSHAATYATSVEAESGTLSGNVVAIADSGASGGTAAKFGSQTGPGTAKPNATNTGVPAGTSLTVVNGSQTFATDGQVISGKDFHGFVTITANNVTIKNSIFRGGVASSNSALLWLRGTNAIIQDSEFVPSNPSPYIDGIWAADAQLLRDNIHGTVDGIKVFDNVLLQDSYVHDMSWFAHDPNQGNGPTHNDALQTYEGNQHINIIHNNLDTGAADSSAYQLTQDSGLRATDIHFDSNWINALSCMINLSAKGGPTPMTGISIINNRFGQDSMYNCPIIYDSNTVIAQSGNVWDATGQPIPPPQRD